MTLQGVDISKWQGLIDFDKLATMAQFVIINACHAKTQDPYLERNVKEAKRVGLPYGLYFFPVPVNLSAFKIQSQIHTDILKQYGSQIYPAWDLEEDGGLDKNDTGNWFEKYAKWFCDYAGIDAYEKTMTYTSPGWFNGQMPLTNTFWRSRLWLADWTPPPSLPYEWSNHKKDALFWQYKIYKPATDYGCPESPNAAHGIDLTQFNGDAAQFEAMFKVKPHTLPSQPPPPPPPSTDPIKPLYRVKVTATALNVRGGPGAEFTDLGDLTTNNVLPIVEEQGDWARIDGWVSKNYVKKL